MSSAWVTLGLVAVLAAMHALLQKELPAYALLLSLGAIVLLLVRLGGTFRSVLEGVALLGQQTDKQAFQCLLRSTGILLLADYTRTLCKESGAEAEGEKEEVTEEKSEGNNMAAMAVGAVVIIGVCVYVIYRRKKA